MSREQSDAEYKSHFKSKGMRHTPWRTRPKKETKVLTGYDSDSAISSVIVDDESPQSSKQGTGNMARQEKTPIESMMEMLITMMEDDRKREERREEKR